MSVELIITDFFPLSSKFTSESPISKKCNDDEKPERGGYNVIVDREAKDCLVKFELKLIKIMKKVQIQKIN